MYYVLSLAGWEEYSPVWFESSLSKEEFDSAVKVVAKSIIEKSLANKELNYIDGHIITDSIEDGKNMLEEGMLRLGFRVIHPDHEITFWGSCLYSKRDDKPKFIFFDDDWRKILEYNERVREEDRKRIWKKGE